MATQAKENLEGKKRWVKMSIDGGDATQAENKVKDFENAFNQSKASFDAAYISSTEKYIEDLRKDLKVLSINNEWRPKVDSWKSRLRMASSGFDSYEPGRGSCYADRDYENIRKAIEEASQKPEGMQCTEYKTFMNEWNNSTKSTMDKKLNDFQLKSQWYDASSSLANWIRPLERDIGTVERGERGGFTDPVDVLQQTAEKTKAVLDNIDRQKWASYQPAKDLLKKVEDLIAKAFTTMDKGDDAKKQKAAGVAAKKDSEAEDKINLAPKDIADALRAGKCSFSASGSFFKRQPYYSCFTCGGGYGICVACKRNACHPADHNYSEVQTGDFYCDCGHSGECKYLKSGPSTPASASTSAAKQPSATAALTCKKNHALQKTSNRNCSCDECHTHASESWQCKPCDYDMCFKCAAKLAPAAQGTTTKAPSGSAVPKCDNNHELQKMTDDCECNICHAEVSESWRCQDEECDYDLCFDCAAKIAPAAQGTTTKGGPSPTPAGADANYKTTTFEAWFPGIATKPAGTFDTSNRQCKSDLKDELSRWNSWAKDFNEAWFEYYKYKKVLLTNKGQDGNAEWLKNKAISALDDAENITDKYRRCQEQIAGVAPGGNQHPACKKIDEELNKHQILIRDGREEISNEYDKVEFDLNVEAYVHNARCTLEEGKKSQDSKHCIYVSGWKSTDSNNSSQLYNYEVFPMALKDLADAKAILNGNAKYGKNHPLLKEISTMEKEAGDLHVKVCTKLVKDYAKEDNLELANTCLDALKKYKGDLLVLKELEKVMNDAKAAATKAANEKREKERKEQEKREKEEQAEAARMAAAWKTPYTGGKIYCEKEVWTYAADGKLTSEKGHDWNWNGMYVSGGEGSGYWNEHSFSWSASNRTIYSFSFQNNQFLPQNEEPVSFKWNGTVLTPSSSVANEAWASRNVRFDGKVPVPVLLAVAMLPWANKRVAECNGEGICRTCLWKEGIQAMTCDNCSTNYNMKCAVCKDKIAFPRNEAQVCKGCNSRSGCVKCGAGFPQTAAYLCDTCHYAFNNYCIRQQRP